MNSLIKNKCLVIVLFIYVLLYHVLFYHALLRHRTGFLYPNGLDRLSKSTIHSSKNVSNMDDRIILYIYYRSI